MKIAVIRQRYVAHGGAENVVARFVDALLSRGHAVHLIAHQWKGLRKGLPAHPAEKMPSPILHPVPMLPGGSFLRLVSFAAAAAWAVRSEPFDLVFSFERTLCQDIYRAGDGCHREWLRRRTPRPFSFRKLNPFHGATLWIERKIYTSPGTQRIIANSHQVKAEIVRHYGTPPEKIEVVHNGVDLNRFHPDQARHRPALRARYAIPEGAFLILFVGSGFERKGLAPLIQAAGRFKATGTAFRLLIVGKGDPVPYLEIADRAGVGQEVIFTGVVDNLPEIYAATDVLALPTRYDPFANVCLEALASGLPVITTRANGASEILTGALSPFVLPDASDVPGLAARLQLACQSDHASLRRHAREIAENFSEARHCDRLLEVCHLVMASSKRSDPSL